MVLFLKSLQIFFRRRRVSVVALLLLAGITAYMVYQCYSYTLNWDIMRYLSEVQAGSLTFFIVSLYISYEYIYAVRHSGLAECAAAHRHGKARLYGSAFCVPACLVFLLFFIPSCFNLGIAIAGGVTDLSYYGHILMVNFLDIFLLCLLASLLGGCLALRLKRIPAYAVMALVIFILSPMSDMLPGLASDRSHINFWPAKWIFSKVLPQNTTWITDFQYGFSNETLRWNLTLFWCFLLLALALPAVLKKKSRARLTSVLLCLLLAGGNLLGYFAGGSEMKLGPYPDSISRGDYEYYRDHPQKQQAAGFTVAAYNMNLQIGRALDATVQMALSAAPASGEYIFTLYRGYEVSSVTDAGGSPLSYVRDGDYITVQAPPSGNTVVLCYSGYSPILYSNSQAALLPGCFPYYPIAGFHHINEGEQGYTPVTNGFSSQFTVRAGGGKPVYCNLPAIEGEKNAFSGTSDCLTLMRGFLTEEEENGFRFCSLSIGGFESRPIDGDYLAELQNAVTKAEQVSNAPRHLDLREKKIFQTYNTFAGWAGYGPMVDLGDHMILWCNNREFINQFAQNLVKEFCYA